MSTDVVFHPRSIRATAVSGGAELFLISLLEEVAYNHNYQDLISHAADQVAPQLIGTHQGMPEMRFSTPQLTSLLTVTVAGDYYIARNLNAHYVDTFYRSGANLGTRVANATASHLRLRAQENTLLALESISAAQGQLATARCRMVHVFNSQTGADPLVATSGLAIAGTVGGGGLHTLGPLSLNGVALNGVFDAQLDNRIQYDEQASAGDGFWSYCGIHRYAPLFTFRCRKTSYLATYGTRGTALSDLTFYLRAKLASGINEADATAAHIKITASSGTIKARGVQGDNSVVELTVEPRAAAENTAAYVIAVNQAIT